MTEMSDQKEVERKRTSTEVILFTWMTQNWMT